MNVRSVDGYKLLLDRCRLSADPTFWQGVDKVLAERHPDLRAQSLEHPKYLFCRADRVFNETIASDLIFDTLSRMEESQVEAFISGFQPSKPKF